jgi:predicted metal-dependent phosphoesterase TrpH
VSLRGALGSVALALLSAGHVATWEEAFERFLEHGRPGFVPRRGASPHDVIRIIHESGGVASVAHPGVTKRDDLLPSLVRAGLDAIEVCHSDHDVAAEGRYRQIARELGALVSGGSDFHGDNGHRTGTLGLVTLPSADYEKLRDRAGARARC